MDKTEILKQYFGHDSFRPGQAEIIDNILFGRDCLGVMPTGAGKSMCFQIPALALHGTTVVISPLISLMKDQVESLWQAGIRAAYINSSLTRENAAETLSHAAAGYYQIIYVAPERLLNEEFLAACRGIEIPLIAVDEAHCVSHWGQDFRPSYLKIPEFIKALPKRPVVSAFTATATDMVKQDIVRILELEEPFSVTTGFDRANLYFEVRPTRQRDKNEALLKILRGHEGQCAIVYCSTRKAVDEVCGFLLYNGIKAGSYHAGMSDKDRRRAQEDFIYDRCSVMVATNAFGMGIDKSDVSLVVHYNMPKDLESYYQEAGRAGRDGSPAKCILLYCKGDVHIAEFLIDHGHEDIDSSDMTFSEREEIRRRDKERLKQMTFYSTTTKCLRHFILSYFGEDSEQHCGNCGNCNAETETLDITVEAQKILSCIYRLKQRGQMCSKALIARILHGSRDERILQNGFDTLSTYGIMRDYRRPYITEVIDYLILQGYIKPGEEYNTLSLTPAADELVKTRRSLSMAHPKGAKPIMARQAGGRADGYDEAEDYELMRRLKELRKKLAATLGVPSYVVFSDAALRDMCAKKPRTQREFLMVSGVGSMKAERYGKQFIAVVNGYLEGQGNEPQ